MPSAFRGIAFGNGGSENLGVDGRGRGDIVGGFAFAFGGNGKTFENLDRPLASSPPGV